MKQNNLAKGAQTWQRILKAASFVLSRHDVSKIYEESESGFKKINFLDMIFLI